MHNSNWDVRPYVWRKSSGTASQSDQASICRDLAPSNSVVTLGLCQGVVRRVKPARALFGMKPALALRYLR